MQKITLEGLENTAGNLYRVIWSAGHGGAFCAFLKLKYEIIINAKKKTLNAQTSVITFFVHIFWDATGWSYPQMILVLSCINESPTVMLTPALCV